MTVICSCWATGCSLFVPKASYPEPPPTSYRVGYFSITGKYPERVQAAVVMPDFFKAVKATPSLGRLFIAEDYQDKAQTILLSHNFWQRRFGGNPNIIGTTIEVDGKPVTMIGVMPNDFDLPRGTEFWRAQELPAP
ncbi:MAG: ABC transporter permease [Acidobacteriota bacterium]